MDENNNPIQESGVNVNNGSGTTTQNMGEKKISSVALISFIMSLIGFWVFGIPLGIASIITGIVGVTKFDANVNKCKGFAIAGIIIGVVDIIGAIVVTIINTAMILS